MEGLKVEVENYVQKSNPESRIYFVEKPNLLVEADISGFTSCLHAGMTLPHMYNGEFNGMLSDLYMAISNVTKVVLGNLNTISPQTMFPNLAHLDCKINFSEYLKELVVLLRNCPVLEVLSSYLRLQSLYETRYGTDYDET